MTNNLGYRTPSPFGVRSQLGPALSAIQLRRSKRSSWNAKQIAQNERLFRRRAERQERYTREFEREREIAQHLRVLEQKVTDTKGAFTGTLFTTTFKTADALGRLWVGEGASNRYYGASAWNSLVSANGSRQYRPPMLKQSGQCEGDFQANYEAKKNVTDTRFSFNAHVTITDLEEGEAWDGLKAGQRRPE